MLGYWDGSIIHLTDGTELQGDMQGMTKYAMSLKENVMLYETNDDIAIEWLAYLMGNGIGFDLTGRRKMCVSCLRGTNRVLYHVSFKNARGLKLRVFRLENLLRSTLSDLETEGYGETKTESIMNILRECGNMDIGGMTIGSEAMRHFRRNMGMVHYSEVFPDIEITEELKMRTGYIGGYVQAKNGNYGETFDYDCNSMYPSILRDEFLPYGDYEKYEGKYSYDEDMPLHIDTLTFRADLKKNGYPWLTIPRTSTNSDSDRIVSTRGYVTMSLCDVDQQLLYDNYDVSVYRHVGGWKFRKSKGFFADYVDIWGAVKQRSTGAKRQMSKLMLNSLVGKFGTFARGKCLIPNVSRETIYDNATRCGKVEWSIGDSPNNQSSHYLPVSIYVNAIARRRLITAMRLNSDRVVYANTDGFVLTGAEPPKGIEQSPTELGKWKTERHWKRLRILGVGLYQGERADGTGYDLVSSGMSRNTPIPWEKFHHGSEIIDDFGNRVVI